MNNNNNDLDEADIEAMNSEQEDSHFDDDYKEVIREQATSTIEGDMEEESFDDEDGKKQEFLDK